MPRQAKIALYIALFLIVLMVVLDVANAFFNGTHACAVARELEPALNTYPSWCVEFWLNRYQGMFGALTTVGAAIAAYFAIQRQIAASLIEGRRRELLHVNNMLTGMTWVEGLGGMLDYKNSLAVRAFQNQAHKEKLAAALAARDQFFFGRQHLIEDHELSMAMSNLHVETSMIRGVFTTIEFEVAIRDANSTAMEAMQEIKIRETLRDEEGRVKSLNSAADRVKGLLKERARVLERAIQKHDPI